jgi:ABC-type branched-subunit amino acid transport system ATPase component/ABC-type branched-subunit amino acid transport system permease subunit
MRAHALADGLAPFGFHLALAPALLGVLSGLTYGLLAVGLVLVYRSSRIINFAQGQMGAMAVAVMGLLTHTYGVPYYLALVPALAAGGAAGGLTELAVVRRLRNAPRLMTIVATLGVGSFLTQMASVISPGTFSGSFLPAPPGLPTVQIGALDINQAYMAMLIFVPVTVAALTVFLRRGRTGLGIRLAAANPDAARMAGISVTSMSSVVWVLAGILSALTAVLVIPASGFSSASSFGPSLLLRALAAAVIARLYSLPAALVAGIMIGVVEQLLLYNYPNSGGITDVVFFVLILGALLVQRRPPTRDQEKGSWASITPWRPLPASVARLPEIRIMRWGLAGAGIVLAVSLPLLVSNASATTLATIVALSIVGLSVSIGAGLIGLLSLGQVAVAAIGAIAAYWMSQSAPFPVALLAAALSGAAAAVVIGAPALRLRGFLVTVTTLGFALATGNWLLSQSWAFGQGGVSPRHPYLFGQSLDTGRSYYYVALVVFLIALLLAWNTRRLSLGRTLLAIRDNEENARAFTIPVGRLKIQSFALAGAIAGLGGAVYLFLFDFVDATSFPAQSSIDVVAMTIIGGLGILLGSLIGAFYIIGLPQFLPLGAAALATTQLGWLILVLYLPGGLGQGLERLRNGYAGWAAARHGLDVAAEPRHSAAPPTAELAAIAERRDIPVARGQVLLEARGLQKAFGGIRAVRDVSLTVNQGEIVGLIGPNGAGKTTTFELLGGFTKPEQGRVIFAGKDVTRLGPERRGRLGLIRSFQDAALFPTLTVTETVRLAFEPTLPTSFTRSVLGIPGTEKERRRKADDLIDLMGLGPYRTKRVQELSTGTRRITELACLIALSPAMLLLDEPSSGVAQRETEALAILLRRLKTQLDLTMLIIEHDIPMIMGLADRIIALNTGSVIACATPQAVQSDPLVIEAYLGNNAAAINRSVAPAPTPEPAP